MSTTEPSNAEDVRNVVEARVAAVTDSDGTPETATIEWRGTPLNIPVISMPVDLLYYNPDTRRIKAQRSLDPARDTDLESNPFGSNGQTYLHTLLIGDPADPSKRDSSFEALKEDVQQHGQTEPGIIARSGVLINGNTRRAALMELNLEHMRVGVLPADAGHDDFVSIELSLQLRKDHRRDYSFMNNLLALEERANAGRPKPEILRDFRIKDKTYDRNLWILEFVREAIDRSRVEVGDGTSVSLRLVDFEIHQGKLEELYRAYKDMKVRSPTDAEALKEARLFAMVFDRSKTDLRLIKPDFHKKYLTDLQPSQAPASTEVKIPGTSVVVPGHGVEVEALRGITTDALKARATAANLGAASPEQVTAADEKLKGSLDVLERGLDRAGKTGRLLMRKLAPADRLGDAKDDLQLAVDAAVEARATGDFDPDDIDAVLTDINGCLQKLAQRVALSEDGEDGEGLRWLRLAGSIGAD